MISVQCALCKEKQKIKELYQETFKPKEISARAFSARRTPDRIHYRFVRCENCGLIFSNPIMPYNKIINLYARSKFDYNLESSYLKKTYGYYLNNIIKNSHRKKLRLLDVGCGNGFFLEEAKKMGIGEAHGIEPGKASVKKAQKWLQKNIIVGILEKGAVKNNFYDIVCCFHTLDHVVDPNEFLQNIYLSLKKGGKALFIVHDTSGLSVKLFGEKSPIFDIEHIFLFNKNNLEKLFKKNKFSVVEIFSVKNTYPLQYWFRMIPLPGLLKKFFLSALFKLKLANFPLSLSAGNIGIIAKKL